MIRSTKGRGSGVLVPVLVVHAAYRLARERSDHTLSSALGKVLVRIGKLHSAASVLNAIKARGPQDIVPFVRDKADVMVAAATSCARGKELHLFSDVACADVGFLRIREREVAYVDRAPVPHAEASQSVELLPEDRMARLLTSLRQLDDYPAAAVVAEDPSLLLEVRSEMLQAWPVQVGTVALTLASPDPARREGASLRRLGACTVERPSPTSFAVRAPAAVALEVHAAALAGRWLELTAPGLRVFTTLPDFTQPGSSVDAWLQPSGALVQAAGGDAERPLRVDRQLALDLCRRHRWSLPLDLDACLEAASGS